MSVAAPDILLVEDSETDIVLFKFAQQSNRSTTTIEIARDGVEAIEFLLGGEADTANRGKSLPRLVLLDLNMPRLDGFDVLQRLRADPRTASLAVVIFSASDHASDEQEARRLGASGYVRKPSRFETLCTTLAELERDWLQR